MAFGFFPHFLPSCCSPDFLSEFQSTSPVPQRIHRTRSASVNSDRYSVSEGADSKSTPQLLGTMGKFETISWIADVFHRNPLARLSAWLNVKTFLVRPGWLRLCNYWFWLTSQSRIWGWLLSDWTRLFRAVRSTRRNTLPCNNTRRVPRKRQRMCV